MEGRKARMQNNLKQKELMEGRKARMQKSRWFGVHHFSLFKPHNPWSWLVMYCWFQSVAQGSDERQRHTVEKHRCISEDFSMNIGSIALC